MAKQHKAYGDGRIWDETQIARVNDLLNLLRDDLDVNNLDSIRKNTLWLMDVVFPTDFTYTVNRGPSEDVHGGYMEGDRRG